MQNEVHVYPLNDLQEHITDGLDCPCDPTVEIEGTGYLVVHNAWDKREIVEQAYEAIYGE